MQGIACVTFRTNDSVRLIAIFIHVCLCNLKDKIQQPSNGGDIFLDPRLHLTYEQSKLEWTGLFYQNIMPHTMSLYPSLSILDTPTWIMQRIARPSSCTNPHLSAFTNMHGPLLPRKSPHQVHKNQIQAIRLLILIRALILLICSRSGERRRIQPSC